MEQTIAKTETVYTYRHASGEVVTVGSFDEALGRCAVLGAESPEDARLLFNLYAQGAEVQPSTVDESEETEDLEAEESEETEIRHDETKTENKKESFEDESKSRLGKKVRNEFIEAKEEITTKKPDVITPEVIEVKGHPTEKLVELVSEIKNEVAVSVGNNSIEPAGVSSANIRKAVSASYTENKEPTVSYQIAKEIDKEIDDVEAAPPGKEVAIQSLSPEGATETFSETKDFSPAPAVQEVSLLPDLSPSEYIEATIEAAEDETLLSPDTIKGANISADTENIELEIDDFTADQEDIAYSFSEVQETQERDNTVFGDPINTVLAPEAAENTGDFTIPHTYEEKPLTVLQESGYKDLPIELRAPVEEVEATLDQLSERMEQLEENETLLHILDEIRELPTKLEISDVGEFINEVEIREELASLFTDLLDQVGIEYTPELIDAFVELSLKYRMGITRETELDDEITDKVPKEKGTHEFITQLLIGIAQVKRTLMRAYLIGKSALHLYDLNAVPGGPWVKVGR